MSACPGPERPIEDGIAEKDGERGLQVQPETANTDGNLATSSPPASFNPGWRFYAAFFSLCIITVAVALDATSLSVALPVRASFHFINHRHRTFENFELVRERVLVKLTRNRSFPSPCTAAPSPPSGVARPSFYPPLSFNPLSLRFPIYLAGSLSFSLPSSSSR